MSEFIGDCWQVMKRTLTEMIIAKLKQEGALPADFTPQVKV